MRLCVVGGHQAASSSRRREGEEGDAAEAAEEELSCKEVVLRLLLSGGGGAQLFTTGRPSSAAALCRACLSDWRDVEDALTTCRLTLSKNFRCLEDLKARLEATQDTLKTMCVDRAALAQAVYCRRASLLHSLMQIFPIENFGDDDRTIRGLSLATSVAQLQQQVEHMRDDDLLSTALGFVLHFLAMIVKYLQVPFRYDMTCASSRSALHDAWESPCKQYPLFFRAAAEKPRLVAAVTMLSNGLLHLMASRRHTSAAMSRRSLLENLEALIHKELWGLDVPSSTFC